MYKTEFVFESKLIYPNCYCCYCFLHICLLDLISSHNWIWFIIVDDTRVGPHSLSHLSLSHHAHDGLHLLRHTSRSRVIL